MCAISGKVQFSGKEVRPYEIKKMTTVLHHRGPDDSGVFISKDRRVGLGNNRLAIIDLSKNGHQPMTYKERYTITFNGEVYNYGTLRENLLRKGCSFASHSDTEVILALYDLYGKSCLNYLRGMFAFAIYDNVERTLFLARDRIGKKPLKYYQTGSSFIFASELKAILTNPEVPKKIDHEAVYLYLTYGYTPAPLTGFRGIKKLEPGSYIFIDIKRKTVTKSLYWEPRFKKKSHLTEKVWCQKILDTLEESTRLRMVSDVPIGTFLSGGVDSSAVVAVMAGLSVKPVKTFTVSFKDTEFDEVKYAANIAKQFKTDHHVLVAKHNSVEILPFLAKQFEEPFADASNVVTYLVSELTRKYVTVVLNGDGGDENFAGYPNRYMRLQRDVDYDFWIQKVRPIAAKLLKDFPRAGRFFDKAKLPLYERFASYNRIFGRDEIINHTKGEVLSLAQSKTPYKIVDECFSRFAGRDQKDAGLKFDLLYYLPDLLLAKVDIASMAVSLEARSPLLDHKMIELAAGIPFDLKIKKGETKYIFKKAVEKIIPKKNIYRKKLGFGLPLHKWFGGKLNGYAKSVLVNKKSLINNYFEEDYIKMIVNDNNKTEDFGHRLWALLSLEFWLRSYFQ